MLHPVYTLPGWLTENRIQELVQRETLTSSSYTKYSAYVFLGIEQHYRS
jgi:hypothetical protein